MQLGNSFTQICMCVCLSVCVCRQKLLFIAHQEQLCFMSQPLQEYTVKYIHNSAAI